MSTTTLTVDRVLLEQAVLVLTQMRDGIASGLLQSFDDQEKVCPEISAQMWYISVIVRSSLLHALEDPHPSPMPIEEFVVSDT